ncbi:MAG: RluA family pseudouridine synthase [Armatimonadota bacterium]|nr:RluA family pseudouridine synthase [Armatimonadota bacterium]MDR7451783.1 RluA family pseudouridine synthase [Armatimonadota bacterium]MDR7467408.1 RluA family pseudouridine synthase [Armatimonadota bacterium]MDR7494178.1 RluA family pseudouridine synthase [Armatimonadota bacterium]MDR7498856.1 RluA family pseudouridine synthase [Armatimonadota bacterium]
MDAVHAGLRLDTFLAGRVPLSRSQIQALIASGHVTLDGRVVKPATKVRAGQQVEMVVPAREPAAVIPQALPLEIVYEDEDLLVVNKPAGLTVHPGAGRPSGTLVNALAARVPGLLALGGGLRPGVVHRLDKDTSGLLVVAKTERAFRALQQQVASRAMRRTYLALVHGVVPSEEGTIEAPIGRHPRLRTRMAVVPGGRPAITRYRIVERFPAHTLIEAELVTGRTHQIRVHFAHVGHPVVGDPVYGGRRPSLGIGRQALHAWRLEVSHPVFGQLLRFEAPPPADFLAAVARARAEGPPPLRRSGGRAP